MDLKDSVRKALRDAKNDSGLTYDQLAESTGLSKSTLNYMFNTGTKMTFENVQKVFDGLNKKVYLVLEEEVYPSILDEN